MKRWNQGGGFHVGVTVLAFWLGAGGVFGKPPESRPKPIMLVVMDPLAKELACACVKGYGQRDYRKLAGRLEKSIKQAVRVEFSDDLVESSAGFSRGAEVVVVGERAVVEEGAKRAGLKLHPVCELTGMDGSTTFTGLFVTRSTDSAKELKEIEGRKVFFGLADVDENHAGAQATR